MRIAASANTRDMSYYRLVTSRAFAETKTVWNIHKVWTYLSVPLSAFALRLMLRGRTQLSGWQDAALFLLFGFVVSWVGTYFINVLRVPHLLYEEQRRKIAELTASNLALSGPTNTPQEQRRREFVAGITRRLTPKGLEILRYINDLGKIQRMSLTHAAGFSDQEVSHFGAVCFPVSLVREAGPGMIEINPELKSAIDFVLDPSSPQES